LREAADLEKATIQVLGLSAGTGWVELLPRATADHEGSRRLDGAALPRAAGDTQAGAKVHFGYRDGLSQPDVAWDSAPLRGQVDRGHFLLGYNSPEVPSAPRAGVAAALFRDSAYMVLRWIKQDVAGFERFLTETAPKLSDQPTPEAREFVAAKLMGRWRDGTPLVLSPDKPDTALIGSDFNYKYQDPDGHKCPFSAHIRVVNPRDQELSSAEVVGTPRVIRRGMPYGPEWPEGQVVDDGIDRGIIGVFLCSSIFRQIYTPMHWLSMTNFSPVFGVDQLHDQDSLLGNRSVPRASRTWGIPRPEGELRLPGLPDFAHTRGTAFFLLPSLEALRWLSE